MGTDGEAAVPVNGEDFGTGVPVSLSSLTTSWEVGLVITTLIKDGSYALGLLAVIGCSMRVGRLPLPVGSSLRWAQNFSKHQVTTSPANNGAISGHCWVAPVSAGFLEALISPPLAKSPGQYL